MTTDDAVIGTAIFMFGLLVLILVAGAIVHVLQDMAEDRKREAEYAEAWRIAHWKHQHDGRYDTDIPGRPE